MPIITDKIKDPDAVLDYFFDWSDWLTGSGEDTIQSALAIPSPAGISVDSFTINEDKTGVTVWISGGTLASGYNIVNRITTVGGRVADKTLRLIIAEK